MSNLSYLDAVREWEEDTVQKLTGAIRELKEIPEPTPPEDRFIYLVVDMHRHIYGAFSGGDDGLKRALRYMRKKRTPELFMACLMEIDDVDSKSGSSRIIVGIDVDKDEWSERDLYDGWFADTRMDRSES